MLFSFLFQQTLKVALIGFACMEKGQFAYGLTYFTEIFDNNFWPFQNFWSHSSRFLNWQVFKFAFSYCL